MPDITAGGVYETSDLGLASLLYAEGIVYHGLRVEPGSWQKWMIFDRPPVELLSGWQSGVVTVNALAYWRASRTLKHGLMQARTD
jgi:hypothetical protein